ALIERCTFERAQLGADANSLKIVEHRLGNVREACVAKVVAGVKTVWIACFGQKLLGFAWIEHRRWRLPEILKIVGDDATCDQRVAPRDRLIDCRAVDCQSSGQPHAQIVPW